MRADVTEKVPKMEDKDSITEIVNDIFFRSRQGMLDYEELKLFVSVLKNAENYPVAAHIYRDWLANTPSPFVANVYCDLGDVLAILKDTAGAQWAYFQALQTFPDYLRARVGLETSRRV